MLTTYIALNDALRAGLESRRSFETPRLLILRSGLKGRVSKGEEAGLLQPSRRGSGRMRRHSKRTVKALMDDAGGATLVENALVVALVAIASIGALTALGIDIRNAFVALGTWITAAVDAASGGGGVSPGPGP